MSEVTIPGGRLFARVDGQEGKPWLVLSNSLATDLGMWDGQMALLTARYRVLRYDTRGHGRSSAPPGPYDFPALVADAVAVMDAHEVARASYMGLSLGGMTGLGLGLAHPERLERLVCCDARADAPPPFVQSWDARLALVGRDGMEGVVGSTIERWLVPATRRDRPEDERRLTDMIRSTNPDGYAGCAAALKRLDYLKDLPRLSVPTLYVTGESDGGAAVPVVQAMADATPGGRLAVVPNAAHIANVDNPEGFADALRGFLL